MCLVLSNFAFGNCTTPDGTEKPVGSIYTVDENNPKTLLKKNDFFNEYGVMPDGGLYKYAICTFAVDLSAQDYPNKVDRKYFWVATSSIPSSFKLDE
jgi:hypothetical protein